jgi:hypothetical protein
MSTHRLLALAVSLGCFAVVGAAWFVLALRTQITRDNFGKIEVGMDLATVETILGGPRRDETTRRVESIEEIPDDMVALFGPHAAEAEARSFGSVVFPICGPLEAELANYARNGTRVWQCDRLIIRVDFADGRVTRCQAMSVRPVPESPLALVRRWFRWN